MSISSTLGWFIPNKLHDDTILFGKSKLLAGVAISLGSFSILIAVRQLSIQLYSNGLTTLVCGILIMAILVSFRYTESLVATSNGITLLLFVLLTYLTTSYGGLASIITPWYVMVVILGIMMSGFRLGIFWGICSFVAVGVMYLVQLNGHVFSTRAVNLTSTFVSFGGLVLIMMVLGLIYENVINKSQSVLDSERKKSDDASKRLTDAINEVNHIMERVTRSDLSQRITGDYRNELDDLKSGINNSIDMLGKTIMQSVNTSTQVNTNAAELSGSAQILSNGASAQAASLEEISASMNEIETRAKANNDNAFQARDLSSRTLEEVKNGNEQMEAMLRSMKEIDKTSSKVTKVIKVIDEIAFQTNLLALNAAVEAARAGKFGKGFAVVAEEVRELAGRSAEAAKDTNELIEVSIKEVENGVRNADQTASVLDTISSSMEKVNDLVGEISSASREQSTNIEEINKSLNQMNDVVQQNSSISEQTAATSELLSSQSTHLQALLNDFKFKEGTVAEQIGPKTVHRIESVPPTSVRRLVE
ncbi:MAG: methyl-accepting chemotaxis protein [Proteobacteria bacterium]|nr:methyl-accepting chemotaxis protein [Pseudomonadota bacterium]